MPLDDYKRKRNFTESPEPAGEASRQSPSGRVPRFFCVQKHLASHLHYDLRLEHNGVLLSWAVPKGPSLDPATRRLAMHVEDHPVEYGDFEGVIPSGYGAGIVMLWDRGSWTPEVDDVDAALKKGDLKFTLDGYKLKGSWVLVRTKGRWAGSADSGDRSWLLIKHRDDWAGSVDIAEFAPLSVKGSGDFAHILAQENPDIWRSNRPAQSGETGALFTRIIARALEMREAPRTAASSTERPAKPGKPATTAKARKGATAARAVKPQATARKVKPRTAATADPGATRTKSAAARKSSGQTRTTRPGAARRRG